MTIKSRRLNIKYGQPLSKCLLRIRSFYSDGTRKSNEQKMNE